MTSEFLQLEDERTHFGEPFLGLFQQNRRVLPDEVEIGRSFQRVDAIDGIRIGDRRLGRLVRSDGIEQSGDIGRQCRNIRADEPDRAAQIVRNRTVGVAFVRRAGGSG